MPQGISKPPKTAEQGFLLVIEDIKFQVVPVEKAVLFYNDRGTLVFAVERTALPGDAMNPALASAFATAYVRGLDRGFNNGRKAAQAAMRSALGFIEE